MGKCALCHKRRVAGHGSFFRIPEEPRKRCNWNKACGFELSSNDFVCADHFLPSDIIHSAQRVRLMPNSVPSVNICATPPMIPSYADGDMDEVLCLSPDANNYMNIMTVNDSEISETAERCTKHTNSYTQTDPSLIQNAMEIEIAALKAENKRLLEENNKLKINILEKRNTGNVKSQDHSEWLNSNSPRVLRTCELKIEAIKEEPEFILP